jgi:hypothetical protein
MELVISRSFMTRGLLSAELKRIGVGAFQVESKLHRLVVDQGQELRGGIGVGVSPPVPE